VTNLRARFYLAVFRLAMWLRGASLDLACWATNGRLRIGPCR
jgi:hypothetical protein